MKIDDLPMHKDTYFFGYGIDIEKPTEMASQIIKLRKENQELEKQFEAVKEVAEEHMKKWVTMQAQQKEFIEWLESLIGKTDYEVNVLGHRLYLARANAYKEILSKYKEIIGDKDEI